MRTTHDLQLFVAMSRALVPRDQLGPHVDEHIAFMTGLEGEGLLFASGPFMDGDSGEGMSIVRASSIDAAKAILDRDPWIAKGYRTYVLREWRLKEGAL